MANLISPECPIVISEIIEHAGIIGIFTDRRVFSAALLTCVKMYEEDGHSLCSVSILATRYDNVGGKDDVEFYVDCVSKNFLGEPSAIQNLDLMKELANVLNKAGENIDMLVIELVYGDPSNDRFRQRATRVLRAEALLANQLIPEALT